MINIQVGRLGDILQAIDKLADVKMTARGGFALARLKRSINEAIEDIRPQATKIIETYSGNETLLQRHLNDLNKIDVALVAATMTSIAAFKDSGPLEPVLLFSLSPVLQDDSNVVGSEDRVGLTIEQIRILRDAILALGKLPFPYAAAVELRRVWNAIIDAFIEFEVARIEEMEDCAILKDGDIVIDEETGEPVVDPVLWGDTWRKLQVGTWPIPVLSSDFVWNMPETLPFAALDGLEWILPDEDDPELALDSIEDV